jgi:hypothetical protein
MDHKFEILFIAFFPIIIVGLILTFSKGKIIDFFSSPTIIYASLIVWTLYGFFFSLDNSMAWGCMGAKEHLLSLGYRIISLSGETAETDSIIFIDFNNVSYSGLSILLISFSFFLDDRKGVIVLYSELVYWLFKLMVIKGGYVVGIGGGPDFDVLLFDSIALTLRLLLIYSRQNFGLIKKIYTVPFSFIVMTLKVFFLT